MEMIGYEEQIQRDKFGVSRCVWAARLGSHDDTVMSAAIAARVGIHEHHKLMACMKTYNMPQSAMTRMETDAKKASSHTGGAYSGMIKKPSMSELRRKYAQSADTNRRTFHG
jgi:hypothetical protein